MTKHVVQHPQVCGYTGMQCIEKLKNAIEPFGMEGHCVLMVMVPGTDEPLGNDHQQQVAGQQPDVVDQKIDSEVDNAQQEHKENRNPILRKSEHKGI